MLCPHPDAVIHGPGTSNGWDHEIDVKRGVNDGEVKRWVDWYDIFIWWVVQGGPRNDRLLHCRFSAAHDRNWP